jgi:uncharacterized Zn finger protein
VTSVADLVEAPALEALAGAYVVTAGTSLADRGAVRLVEFDSLQVVAEVDDQTTARVELRSGSGRLEWSCSCPSGSAGTPCPHMAAAAVETGRRAPEVQR